MMSTWFMKAVSEYYVKLIHMCPATRGPGIKWSLYAEWTCWEIIDFLPPSPPPQKKQKKTKQKNKKAISAGFGPKDLHFWVVSYIRFVHICSIWWNKLPVSLQENSVIPSREQPDGRFDRILEIIKFWSAQRPPLNLTTLTRTRVRAVFCGKHSGSPG